MRIGALKRLLQGMAAFEKEVVVPANSPHLEEVWEYCSTGDGMVEVYNVEILDVTALRGYIFASRRPAEMPQPPQTTAAAR